MELIKNKIQPESTRIPELDGIRGIAIILVIIWHYLNYQLIKDNSWIVNNVLLFTGNFWCGVDLFFILSGFLVGGILFRNKSAKNLFKVFYIRRTFRIFPIYYIVISIYILLILLISNIESTLPYLFKDQIPIWPFLIYMQNYEMIIHQSFGAGWLAVTWSLAIEEQFYLILPVMIYFCSRRIILIFTISMIIISIILKILTSNLFITHISFPHRMDNLFSGVLIAILIEKEKFVNYVTSNKILINIVLLLFVLLFFLISYQVISLPGNLIYTLINFMFIFLILTALLFRDGIVLKILRISLLRKIGVISYGIYLYHVIIIYLVYALLERLGISTYNNIIVLFTAVISFYLTYIISKLSFNKFENKLISYSHKFRYNP